MSNENTADRNTTRATLKPDGAVMIEQPNGGWQKAEPRTDWDRVAALTDQEIDDDFWLNAPAVMPTHYQGVRLDVDVLDWFKA